MLLFVYLSSVFLLLSAIIVMKKIKSKQKVVMGGYISYLWWGGDPDTPNPVSGLTKREIHAVKKSWAPVYANYVPNGAELLKRYFRAYPETKEFFKMIKNVKEEDYLATPHFKAHVINLMTSLNLAVTSLDQPEVAGAMMMKLGESHRRRRIKEHHFHDLKKVLVAMFIEVLKLDNFTLEAWGKTVDFLYKNLFETLNQAS